MHRTNQHNALVVIERRTGEILVQVPNSELGSMNFPSARIEDRSGNREEQIREQIQEKTGIWCREMSVIFDRIEDHGTDWTRTTVYRCLGWNSEYNEEDWQWRNSNTLDVTRFTGDTRLVMNALRHEDRYRTSLKRRIRDAGTRQVVAAGVVERPDGKILVEKRAENGKWCHPGGKAHEWETPEETLVREMEEELGIRVREARHLVRIDRPDELDVESGTELRIEVFQLLAWDGEPKPMEGQVIKWMSLEEMELLPRLDAAKPINAKLMELRNVVSQLEIEPRPADSTNVKGE